MDKPRDDCCGCCGPAKPLYELRQLIEVMERKAMSTARRIISEIESYLSSPVMRNAESYWELQERRSLVELLAVLSAEA